MAESILKHLMGRRIFVDSIGVRPQDADPFAVAAMDEIGIDLSGHRPKSFDELADTSFDLVISLSPEAHHRALELTRTMAVEAEYWPTLDPAFVTGSREQVMDSFRGVRDALLGRIKKRFRAAGGPAVRP